MQAEVCGHACQGLSCSCMVAQPTRKPTENMARRRFVLLLGGPLLLPDDHPERQAIIEEARQLSSEIGMTTVPIDVALGRVASA